jgi:hypothetical protein
MQKKREHTRYSWLRRSGKRAVLGILLALVVTSTVLPASVSADNDGGQLHVVLPADGSPDPPLVP